MEIISEIRLELIMRLADAYLKAEDNIILHGSPVSTEQETYKWHIHGIGYNDHYSAAMSYFSSHQLNILKANGIVVWRHEAINRSRLFNTGIGIGVKLKRKLIYAYQIGLITLV